MSFGMLRLTSRASFTLRILSFRGIFTNGCLYYLRADEEVFTKDDVMDMLDSIGNKVRVSVSLVYVLFCHSRLGLDDNYTIKTRSPTSGSKSPTS